MKKFAGSLLVLLVVVAFFASLAFAGGPLDTPIGCKNKASTSYTTDGGPLDTPIGGNNNASYTTDGGPLDTPIGAMSTGGPLDTPIGKVRLLVDTFVKFKMIFF